MWLDASLVQKTKSTRIGENVQKQTKWKHTSGKRKSREQSKKIRDCKAATKAVENKQTSIEQLEDNFCASSLHCVMLLRSGPSRHPPMILCNTFSLKTRTIGRLGK